MRRALGRIARVGLSLGAIAFGGAAFATVPPAEAQLTEWEVSCFVGCCSNCFQSGGICCGGPSWIE